MDDQNRASASKEGGESEFLPFCNNVIIKCPAEVFIVLLSKG